MEPSDYGFSEELIDLLRRWHLVWERVASSDIGQPVREPSGQERIEEQSLRRQAIAVIRREVSFDVQVNAG